jgi:phospholipid/cholesterol/gamma-HCH transport system substrate-binding protein
MNRRTLINLVFFLGVFALMLFWAVNNIITVDRIDRPYTITGDFAQAAGVKANAEVTYLGVHYGRVSGVERRPGGVSVTMKIDRKKDIPAGSIARIFRKSAIGEPYIDFKPPEDYAKGTAARIEPGENVPQSRTTVPLEFSELLRSAGALISSIDPDAAGSLVHELALALDGRGDDLRTLTTSMDQITASFVQKTDQLDRLAENSTRVTSVLADHRLSLGRSITNLRAVAEALRQANGDTRVLLDLGPDFLRTTADLVADQKKNLDCLLTDLTPVLRSFGAPGQVANLSELLQKGPLAFGYVAAAVDQEADGPWVRINLVVPVGGQDPVVYVPKKSLPVVPSVAGCVSTLTPASVASASSGGRTAARPGSSGVVGRLVATGGEPVLGLSALLAIGGLLTWRARRPGTRHRAVTPTE